MADKFEEKRAYDAGYRAGHDKLPKSGNPHCGKDQSLELYWNMGHDRATAGKEWENLE